MRLAPDNRGRECAYPSLPVPGCLSLLVAGSGGGIPAEPLRPAWSPSLWWIGSVDLFFTSTIESTKVTGSNRSSQYPTRPAHHRPALQTTGNAHNLAGATTVATARFPRAHQAAQTAEQEC
mgnify:CR=1 FL=1